MPAQGGPQGLGPLRAAIGVNLVAAQVEQDVGVIGRFVPGLDQDFDRLVELPLGVALEGPRDGARLRPLGEVLDDLLEAIEIHVRSTARRHTGSLARCLMAI